MNEAELIKKEIDRIKHRIETLNLIEEKFYEIRILAVLVATNDFSQDVICKIQDRVNQLYDEINSLSSSGTPGMLH